MTTEAGEGPARAFERELLKGSTGAIILSLLIGEPMYGYQLTKEIAKRSEGYFKIKGGTLYPALHRLEREGLIQGRWHAAPSQQHRRYYFLTERGKLALTQRQAHWQGFARAVSLIMLPKTPASA